MTLPEWFSQAGFGLFVHWDHASRQGLEIGWPLVGKSILPGRTEPEADVTVAEYQSSAAEFDPRRWDPRAVARLARDAGARYVVFTVRHHAGYSMYHTRHSEFSVEASPYGRDITREFFDALRAEGLRVGVYYSLLDWNHPDYPAFTDADRPYPYERYRRPSPEQWARYIDYVKGQLTELLTEYGPIDLLWFDGEWERTAEEWHAAELRELIKSLQPDVIINDRLPGQGDYATPEQGMPRRPPAGPWELCLTMSESWAYRPDDLDYKSPRMLAGYLSEVVSRGGNLLLNIGPRGDGSLVPTEVATLKALGAWLAGAGESIIGAGPAPERLDFHGPATRRGDQIYLHLLLRPQDDVLIVRNVPIGSVTGVRLLGTEQPLPYAVNEEVHKANGADDEPLGELFITVPPPTGALIDVIAIELSPSPKDESRANH
ncbi:alpha-L-fucosidase [Actinoallomurus vinaceus]|uniref:alpha-L-fucosidase n=1 Tax=Actinoallomurus vinaceus TaxID=1080074 RepID=A0ABP8U9T3_9ACTN